MKNYSEIKGIFKSPKAWKYFITSSLVVSYKGCFLFGSLVLAYPFALETQPHIFNATSEQSTLHCLFFVA